MGPKVFNDYWLYDAINKQWVPSAEIGEVYERPVQGDQYFRDGKVYIFNGEDWEVITPNYLTYNDSGIVDVGYESAFEHTDTIWYINVQDKPVKIVYEGPFSEI